MKNLSSLLGIILLFICLGACSKLKAQTPFDLASGNFSFSAWSAASAAGTFPPSMAFLTTNVADPKAVNLPTRNYPCIYNGTRRSRFIGLDTGGIQFLLTSSSLDTLACPPAGGIHYPYMATVVLNATGRDRMTMSFRCKVDNLSASPANDSTRMAALKLVYRLNPTDTFSAAPSGLSFQTVGRLTGEIQEYTTDLPTEFNNQSFVQIAWVYNLIPARNGTFGAGTRPYVSLDNISIASLPLSVAKKQSHLDFQVFPNPTTSSVVNLLLPETLKGQSVAYRLINAQGQLVLNQTSETPSLSLAGLPAGLYLLEAQSSYSIGRQSIVVK